MYIIYTFGNIICMCILSIFFLMFIACVYVYRHKYMKMVCVFA